MKCDNKSPCDNCVRREHAQLCSYKPNRASNAGKPGSETSQSRKREHSPDEQGGRRLSNDAQPDPDIRVYGKCWPPACHGHIAANTHATLPPELDSSDASRYLGQNSIPALLREQGSPNAPEKGDTIRQDMRSILGLDNTAPFPLMSARHLDRMTHDIAAELPSDRQVMKCVSSPLSSASSRSTPHRIGLG